MFYFCNCYLLKYETIDVWVGDFCHELNDSMSISIWSSKDCNVEYCIYEIW